MDIKDIDCKSCWSETLMDLGIYSSYEKIPRNKIKEAKEIYENIFYQSHDVNKMSIDIN
jgi:hypothetical protein